MASAARALKIRAWSKRWLSDPSTYPIIGVMGTACVLYATMATHELRHPAAKFTPAERELDVAPDAAAAARWSDHAARRHAQSRLQTGAKREEQQSRVNVEILGGFNALLRRITGNKD